MVNNDGSGATKRRRKRQTLTYKTQSEKRRNKSILANKSAGSSLSLSTSSTVGSKNDGDNSSLVVQKSVKDLEDSRGKQSSPRKSVKRPSGSQIDKLKSITKRLTDSEQSTSSHVEKDSQKKNKSKAGDVPISMTSKDVDNCRKKQPSPTKNSRKASVASTSTSGHIEKGSKKKTKRKGNDTSVSMTLKDVDDGRTKLLSPNKNSRKTSVAQAEKNKAFSKRGKRLQDKDGESIQHSSPSPPKKAKTSEKASNDVSLSKTLTEKTDGQVSRVRIKQRSSIIPDRIKDVCVTKKTYQKWKPLTKSTKEYTDEVLKSIILNVMATSKDNEEANNVLTTLRNKILEKLPEWKAPQTQGDYRKMESQNDKSEQLFLKKSREINALDNRIEEEQRLLEIESAKVEELTNKLELCKKELCSLDNEKAHPLIHETQNVLDLPRMPQEIFDKMKEVPTEQGTEEENLCETLLQLRDTATSLGLTEWMTKLTSLTQTLDQEN